MALLLQAKIGPNEASRKRLHYSKLLFMTDRLVVHRVFELACPKLGKTSNVTARVDELK
jgi:hypothetical protein